MEGPLGFTVLYTVLVSVFDLCILWRQFIILFGSMLIILAFLRFFIFIKRVIYVVYPTCNRSRRRILFYAKMTRLEQNKTRTKRVPFTAKFPFGPANVATLRLSRTGFGKREVVRNATHERTRDSD